jgi:hypothetical protein
MSIVKPYFRIWRDGETTSYDDEKFFPYILDPRYCQERTSLCRAYKILEQDLEILFEYIEPCDANKSTYSHRTFELMLRASTEFEANCKGILLANGYSPTRTDRRTGNSVLRSSDEWKIDDYWKINRAIKLADYKVLLKSWHPSPLQLQPFRQWHGVPSHQGLDWYKAYNEAKHNRDTKFQRSNFENTIEAIAGLLCVLFAQFNVHATCPYRSPDWLHDLDAVGMQGLEGSMFDIAPPTWTTAESYDFDWKVLKHDPVSYENFSF